MGMSEAQVDANVDRILCRMMEGSVVSEADRELVVRQVTARIANSEQGDDLPIAMKALGCDYEDACNAVFAGNREVAMSLLNAAIAETAKPNRSPSPGM